MMPKDKDSDRFSCKIKLNIHIGKIIRPLK